MIIPGDRLDLEIELIKMRGPLGKVRCQARVGDKVSCEGEISFAMLKREDQ
jgi:3-hydroxyacyl-[acyl-carrier-protein] dehydratase